MNWLYDSAALLPPENMTVLSGPTTGGLQTGPSQAQTYDPTFCAKYEADLRAFSGTAHDAWRYVVQEIELEETAHRLQTVLDAVTKARRNLPSDDDGDLASAQTVYVQQQLEVLAEGTELSQADVQTGLSAIQKKRERIMAALAILSPELHTHFTGQARACQVESAQKSSQLQFNVFQTDKSGAERKSHSCRLPGAQSDHGRFETELLEACGEIMWRNRGDGNREKQSRWY